MLSGMIGTSAPEIGNSAFRIPLLGWSIHNTYPYILIISQYRISSNFKNLHFLVKFMVDILGSTIKIKYIFYVILNTIFPVKQIHKHAD